MGANQQNYTEKRTQSRDVYGILGAILVGGNMTIHRHRFHGDPERFEEIAAFVLERYGKRIRYIADVAGGQGMLSRMLNKKGYESEVIDPRGYTLKGVPSRTEEYKSDMADYYDLVIGLHPDEAIREVAQSALVRPTLLVPCCNFWDRTTKLGREELLKAIEKYYDENGISYERIVLNFKGPHNIALVSEPKAA